MQPFAFSVIALLSACSSAFGSDEASVKLPFGVVRGRLLEFSQEFLSIPYAAKPERFAPPKPWAQNYPNNSLDATRFGPMCIQWTYSMSSGATASEDCLFLNIYTPRPHITKSGKGLPVMVWIHGGSLQQGTAMKESYNGSIFAHKQGVIVVSINYRLAIFGFAPVQLPDAPAFDNNGFRDQREALKWVRQHIRAFGGDPGNVTIFGQSSGGMSVTVQTVSPGSAGLFHRTIMESGQLTKQISLREALKATDVLANAVGCDGSGDLQCLQKADLEMLLNASGATNAVIGSCAIIGGEFMPASMIDLIKRGHVNSEEIVMGTNQNEAVIFVYLSRPKPTSPQQVRCLLDKTFGNKSDRILELYSPTNGIDNRPLLSDVASDVAFKCDVLEVANVIAKQGVPIWMYNFKRHLACTNKSYQSPPMDLFNMLFGAFHGAEMPYIFGFPSMSACQPSPYDVILSEQIGSLWGGFAKHGASALAGWPRYNDESREVMNLDVGSIPARDTEKGYRRGQCDALQQLGINYNNANNNNYNNAPILASLYTCQEEIVV